MDRRRSGRARVPNMLQRQKPTSAPILDGVAVPAIHSDLSAGGTDLTQACPLPENTGTCFMGTTKVGPFDVDAETARRGCVYLPTRTAGRMPT